MARTTRTRPARPARAAAGPVSPPAPPGALDPIIMAALAANRPLTRAERATIDQRHGVPDGPPPRLCPTCRFTFARKADSCPSVVFFTTGSIRAAAAATPPAQLRKSCRQCGSPTLVAAGTRGRPLCDACQDQPDLFGGTP